MWQQLLPAFRMTLVMTILTGLIYPAAITGICQALFSRAANGSMLSENGKTVGSALIGQRFTRPEYFHARPSAAGNDGYDALASQGSNFGPTNKRLVDRVQGDIGKLRKENAGWSGPIPADAVTASGSGLDPQISPAFAQLQIARVAASRHLDGKAVQELVDQNTQPRTLGFLGEPAVNVLELNLELDRRQAR